MSQATTLTIIMEALADSGPKSFRACPKKLVEIIGRKYLDEAMQQIDRAIKQEPRFMDNYVYKARFIYVYFDGTQTALKLLDTEMKMDLNCFPEEVATNRASKDTARQLWKEITGKEYPQR
jgi:hypothetical protein